MTHHTMLEYGVGVFVSGGFKVCIRQQQESTENRLVFDDAQIDALVDALRSAQRRARRQRSAEIKPGRSDDDI